jgi:hypothetical protein
MPRDITADIGPLYRGGWKPKIPMYSYERPAYILWQAVFEGLQEGGMTETQALDWLQSKNPRWLLDGSLGEALRQIGKAVGREHVS